ncbi:MAG: sulfatase family protein, partial [Bryobacteraceae bacterium]
PFLLPAQNRRRPNILFAIADDQSWQHVSAAGDPVVKTPAFDRIAEEGAQFTNAFCASPGCAPSRAALLTGRPHWQLEEAGTHGSLFPKKFAVYPGMLEQAGYFIGLTGKGAGPCNWKESGWSRNPAGPSFDARRLDDAPEGISKNDYAGNFREFLTRKRKGQPFCFWYGGTEPHRIYQKGAGLASGKRLEDVRVPPFLPDSTTIRGDLLDYYTEIEHFDRQLGQMLKILEEAGEIENTLIVATSDNGMSFPHAKANNYEYGVHLPLAVCWVSRFRGGHKVDDIVSFLDFAPTFLAAAGLNVPEEMTGRSLLPVLEAEKSGIVDPKRNRAFFGRERHSHARYDNLGYPSRGMRTPEYLYVRNFTPDRWPAGAPEDYYDIDASPSKTFLLENREKPSVRPLFEAGFGKRPGEELFDIRKDPGCLKNLADSPDYKSTAKQLGAELESTLTTQRDPRMLGTGDVFESYPRFGAMRPHLGGFSNAGEYNPKYGNAAGRSRDK